MSTGFWESLRIGFLQLRQECAINPPSKPAGRLTAIWTAQPPPGEWELSYWEEVDGYGVTKRFEWHAQSAAARLGFGETGQKAVWFWLDRVRRDAPESHIRRCGTEELFSVEILDICGLSAEYCRKCEADEIVVGLQSSVARTSVKEPPAPKEQPATRSGVAGSEKPGAHIDSTNRSSGGADKGNLKLLQGVTGKRKDLVTFNTAAKFGGVTKRAIEKAAAKGSLKAVGSSRNRRISVPSLLEYFPPENSTN